MRTAPSATAIGQLADRKQLLEIPKLGLRTVDAMVMPKTEVCAFQGGDVDHRTSPLRLFHPRQSLLSSFREITPDGDIIQVYSVQSLLLPYLHEVFGYFPPADLLSCHGGDYTLFGFDVVELDGLNSALVGFSYSDWESGELKKRFGGRLSKWGLFESSSDALLFCEARSMVLKEHLPLTVIEVRGFA